MVAPKSAAGSRRVPIATALRGFLTPLAVAASNVAPESLVFGREGLPFSASPTSERAVRAWTRTGLEPICLHDCRHTFASLMIAAGVNAKALSTFMGHANISITLDRYGHLMPGAEDEAAGLMDLYLQGARASALRDTATETEGDIPVTAPPGFVRRRKGRRTSVPSRAAAIPRGLSPADCRCQSPPCVAKQSRGLRARRQRLLELDARRTIHLLRCPAIEGSTGLLLRASLTRQRSGACWPGSERSRP